MTTNIQRFDTNAVGLLSDADYQSSSQRANGFSGIAQPALANKALYQLSAVCAAFGQALSDLGETVSDSNFSALVLSIKKIFANPARFSSTAFTISPGTAPQQAHGLTAQPTRVEAFLKNVTPEYGYVAGQEIPVSVGYGFYTTCNPPSSSRGVQIGQGIATDTTNITVIFPQDGAGGPAGYLIADKTSGNIGNVQVITNANWNLIVRASL